MTPSPAQDDEPALVRQALAGEDAAFGAIVRHHRDALYRIALASLGNAEDALDAVQDSFVAAHLALRRFDRARPLRPWLARITLNQCRDRLRRRAVRRFLLPFAAAPADIADPAPDPASTVTDRDALERTLRAISGLPPSLREPLVLTAIEGMAQAEVAALLNVSAKAIELRVRRARTQLRENLPT